MKKAFVFVLVLVMALSLSSVFAFAETYSLPTTYGDREIDWEITSKQNKPAVFAYYGGVGEVFQALINIYQGWEGITDEEISNQYQIGGLGRYQADVASWLQPDCEEAPGGGYLVANYPDITYTAENGTWRIAKEGLLYIESLSSAQKKAAEKEIAYFNFLVEKEEFFFTDANENDAVHQGLDVLPFIMRDALAAVQSVAATAPDTSDTINAVAVFVGMAAVTVAVVVLKKEYN